MCCVRVEQALQRLLPPSFCQPALTLHCAAARYATAQIQVVNKRWTEAKAALEEVLAIDSAYVVE